MHKSNCRWCPNVIVVEHPVQDWLALFPDPVLAQAAVDRMRQKAHLLTIEGDSYRARLAPHKIVSKTAA